MITPVSWATPIDDFISTLHMRMLSEGTIYRRRNHLERLALAFPAREPWTLTSDEMAIWLTSQGWSRATVRSFRASVTLFYRWGKESDRSLSDPAARLPRIKRDEHLPRPAAPADVAEALFSADERVRLMIRLGYEAGLRRAEVSVCNIKDIVRSGYEYSLIVHGKGSKDRILPISEGLAAAMRLAAGSGGWCFPGNKNGHLAPHRVGELVVEASKGTFTTHQLRHLFATEIYQETGGDIRAVQVLLGHTNISTTTQYIAVVENSAREAVIARANRRPGESRNIGSSLSTPVKKSNNSRKLGSK
jgi:site-specific recombinase XerD